MGQLTDSGYLAPAQIVLSAELNALANGSASALGAEIDNSSTKYRYADVEVILESAAFSGVPYVEIFAVPIRLDESGYPEWDSGASPGIQNANYLIGRVYIKASTAGHNGVGKSLQLKCPGKFKPAARNGAGAAFSGTNNNQVKFRFHNDAY